MVEAFKPLYTVKEAAKILKSNPNMVLSLIHIFVNLDGKVIGFIQNQCEVQAQKDTIQAYGISDLKEVIEHLSNNQDIVYIGIVGADVTRCV